MQTISEFTIRNKSTPQTAVREHEEVGCHFCAQNLAVTSQLRKKEILLELENEKLKEQFDLVEKRNQELIQAKVLTYHQYQQRVEKEQMSAWNRQDVQAELFQLKLVNQLLLLSKVSHPQIKMLTDESLKQKYTDLLIQSIRMREQIEARDRIIAEKQYFPLYHYDQRVSTLRKAVAFWYRKAEEDCNRMKAKCREMKLRLEEECNWLRQKVEKELQQERAKLMSEIVGFNQSEECMQSKKKPKKNIICESAKLQKKVNALAKKPEIKILR